MTPQKRCDQAGVVNTEIVGVGGPTNEECHCALATCSKYQMLNDRETTQ
jgi:hypothetical protein